MKTNSPIQIVWKREDGVVILQAEYVSFLDAWRLKLFKERKANTISLPVNDIFLTLNCITASERATKTLEEIGHE